MTALCGGGTSGPRFLVGATIDYTAARLAIALENAGTPWLIEAIPVLALAPLVINTFCGTDPPAVPVFTQAEVNALLQLTLGADFVSGLSKFKDWVLNAIWNDACVCTSGTYTPPGAPAQPAGAITVVTPTSAPGHFCAQTVGSTIVNAGGQNFANRGSVVFPAGVVVTAVKVHVDQSITVAPGCDITYTVHDDLPTAVNVRLQNFTVPAGTTSFDFVFVPLSGDSEIGVNTAAAGTGTETNTITCTAYCGGAVPGSVQPACCPPDDATNAMLRNILDTVVATQRNYAPFAYVLGSAHAGLTGTGSVPVSRLIGAKVAVTAFPGSNQQLPGNPAYVKDLGWMSVSEVDGMIQERRVTQLAFTWFPQLMPIADHINYDFFPGVTATITELQPES